MNKEEREPLATSMLGFIISDPVVPLWISMYRVTRYI